MKRFISLLLAVMLVALMTTPTFAFDGFSADTPRLTDRAQLLDAAESEHITKLLDELSELQQFDVIIVTVETTGAMSPRDYADAVYDHCGFGFGENNDGILLLISMEERDWYISTSGFGITAFTDAGIEYIGEALVEYLSDGYYALAFEEFVSLTDAFLNQAKSGEAYDVGNMPSEPFSFVFWMLTSIVIGFVIALIVVAVMKSKLRSVRPQRTADRYMKRDSMNLTESRDLYLYNTITRTPKPKDNSSSGGSSTHRSSSGARHGGGGGKF